MDGEVIDAAKDHAFFGSVCTVTGYFAKVNPTLSPSLMAPGISASTGKMKLLMSTCALIFLRLASALAAADAG